ncbi:hypothetical protein GCM10022247_66550 [Allokutzneria multivorans]|uniref:FAD-binding domain-containing protein n=1 Tax=Allokutzneria multivorans TaxID=1142134 RepID=A0ABP7TW87_9PSEU
MLTASTWIPLRRQDSTKRLPIRTSVPVPKWESSNVTVLGDAIHSMTPFRGIGADIALRDAQLLCRKLIEPDRPLLSRLASHGSAVCGGQQGRALGRAHRLPRDGRGARLEAPRLRRHRHLVLQPDFAILAEGGRQLIIDGVREPFKVGAGVVVGFTAQE